MAQKPLMDAVLVVKTEAEPMSVARGIIELLYAVDPTSLRRACNRSSKCAPSR